MVIKLQLVNYLMLLYFASRIIQSHRSFVTTVSAVYFNSSQFGLGGHAGPGLRTQSFSILAFYELRPLNLTHLMFGLIV